MSVLSAMSGRPEPPSELSQSTGSPESPHPSHADATQSYAATLPDLSCTLATLTADEKNAFTRRLAERREAGEPEPGIGWRALVDVRLSQPGWSEVDRKQEAENYPSPPAPPAAEMDSGHSTLHL